MRLKKNDRGFSLIELIIAITIMAVLVGLVTPQYITYLKKSQKKTDMKTAAEIGDIVNRAMIDNSEAYYTFDDYDLVRKRVSVTYNGTRESYDVYWVMVNEDRYKYWFYGTMGDLKWKSNDNIGFYNYVNQELGFEGVMKGNGNWAAVRENTAITPQFKTAPEPNPHNYKIDRWRIVKRVDNGTFEVWSACDYHDGQSGGGKPCYRVWPNPDDLYTK